ncbi:MAG: leucyl/phenylalanyl-tRNA--protein transferase [Moraxellaceae bacterium]|nr:leucyl/phenylalanyl-tRNA--protein transferase [Pseudomonadales bacterium]MCP5174470.1 leucyl/phenylalanyl-tRNA--protein transferase [Moraxellaceae bacterium]MCP5177719.1 leucyl/phenylalanyl-tRNA--protein transferase [Moraxellaceae bacterium]
MPIFIPPKPVQFPPIYHVDNDGLLAYGGDLSPQTLLKAYHAGVFPWYNQDEHCPILWWCPNPRCVIYPTQFKASRSLKKTLKANIFSITVDSCFEQVIQACAAPRAYADSTWINPDIIKSYTQLHQQGIAHSVEVWNQEQQLVGGLYGLNLGKLFFGESMFSTQTDASKVAFAFLMNICAQWHFPLVDCQLPNNHLMSLGASTLARDSFLALLQQYKDASTPDWRSLQNTVHLTDNLNHIS